MDEIVGKIREVAEGQIDFEGQRLSELIATVVLACVGAIAFVVGYILQDITLALYTGLVGTALAFLLIIPPWPFYNKHPEQWVSVAGSGIPSQGITVDGKTLR